MNILVADDHELIINGVTDLLKTEFNNAKIYAAINKLQLFNILNSNKIDVLLQDVRFGKDDALNFITEIKLQQPNLIIIALTSITNTLILNKLISLKVNGIVLKSEKTSEIITAINCCLSNQFYLSAEVKSIKKTTIQSNEIVLSKREKEILKEILKSKTIKQIADELFISTKTVEMHRSNLFLKFDVKNVAGLVNKALTNPNF